MEDDVRQRFERLEGFLAEHFVRFEERMSRSEARVDRLERTVSLAIRVGARQIRQLRESQQRTATHVQQLAEAHLRTEEALRQTDERLNALISVVDGFVRRPPEA